MPVILDVNTGWQWSVPVVWSDAGNICTTGMINAGNIRCQYWMAVKCASGVVWCWYYQKSISDTGCWIQSVMLQCNASKCSWRAHFCDPQPSSFQQEQYCMFINNIHIFLSGICQWQCLAVTVIGVHLWQWLAVALICVHQWQWQVPGYDNVTVVCQWMCLAITYRCVCVCVCQVFVRQVFFALVGFNSLSVLDRCLCHVFAYQCQTGVCVDLVIQQQCWHVCVRHVWTYVCMPGMFVYVRQAVGAEGCEGWRDAFWRYFIWNNNSSSVLQCLPFTQEKCLFLWWNFECFWWKTTASAFHSAFVGRAFWHELSFLGQLLSWISFCFFDCGLRSRWSKLPNWLLTKAVVSSSRQQQQKKNKKEECCSV